MLSLKQHRVVNEYQSSYIFESLSQMTFSLQILKEIPRCNQNLLFEVLQQKLKIFIQQQILAKTVIEAHDRTILHFLRVLISALKMIQRKNSKHTYFWAETLN